MAYKNISDRRAFLKRWREKNKEKLSAIRKSYYLKNKDKIKKKSVASSRAYYLKNREKILAYGRAYRERNPDYMKKYDLSRNRTRLGRLRIMFKGINKRIKHKNSYKSRRLCFTYKQFVDKFINDEQFGTVFDCWVDSGYVYSLCPSLDRINNDGDYTLDNVQVLSISDNSSKKRKKVV